MKKVLSVVLLILSISTNFYGQNTLGIIYYDKPKVQSFHEELIASKTKLYTTNDWQSGSMILKDYTLINPASFKYDAKNDRFEIRLIVDPRSIDKIVMGGNFFIYTSFINYLNNEQFSYFEILMDGEAKLLLRKFVKKVPKRSGAYGNESYSTMGEKQYLKVGDKPAIMVKSSALVLRKQFDKNENKVNEFIANKKLKIDRKRDLQKLIEYYNSLK